MGSHKDWTLGELDDALARFSRGSLRTKKGNHSLADGARSFVKFLRDTEDPEAAAAKKAERLEAIDNAATALTDASRLKKQSRGRPPERGGHVE